LRRKKIWYDKYRKKVGDKKLKEGRMTPNEIFEKFVSLKRAAKALAAALDTVRCSAAEEFDEAITAHLTDGWAVVYPLIKKFATAADVIDKTLK
jgi:hypothetical protein